MTARATAGTGTLQAPYFPGDVRLVSDGTMGALATTGPQARFRSSVAVTQPARGQEPKIPPQARTDR